MIGLRLAPGILDIDPGISGPWSTIDPVAGARLTWLSEKVIAYLAQVTEANPLRVPPQFCHDILYRCQRKIVSLMILKSRIGIERRAGLRRRITGWVTGAVCRVLLNPTVSSAYGTRAQSGLPFCELLLFAPRYLGQLDHQLQGFVHRFRVVRKSLGYIRG